MELFTRLKVWHSIAMKWKATIAYIALNLALLLGFVSTVIGFATIVPATEKRTLIEAICMGCVSLGLLGLAYAWKAKWFWGIGALALLFACAGILLSGSRLLA